MNPTARDDGLSKRQNSSILWTVRVVFMILWLAVTFIAIFNFGGKTGLEDSQAYRFANEWWWPLSISLALFAAVIVTDIATPTKKLQTLSGIFMGLMAGILAAVAVGFIIDLIARLANFQSPAIIGSAQVLIGVACSYLGITIVLQTQDDFRLIIPYVEFAKQIRGVRPLLLDTSTLIDARFVGLAETGVTQAPILIPSFVLGELQSLADSADRSKRQRGRRGLDVVSKLQRSPRLDVTIDETIVPGKNVDQMLVELGLLMTATIITTDSGLERIGGIKGVNVLNMNDIANSVKTQAAPGEVFDIRIIRAGEQPGQGVGYLDDGTMIVAVDGGDRIGEIVTVTVINSLQTSAGRLIFGRIGAETDEADHAGGAAPTDEPAPGEPPSKHRRNGPIGPSAPSTTASSSHRNPRR